MFGLYTPAADESDQGQQRGHQHEPGDGPAARAVERIGVEEPELLDQGPHKQEVQVAEPGHARDRDQTVDDDDGTGEGLRGTASARFRGNARQPAPAR
jgi:hypothetical protein